MNHDVVVKESVVDEMESNVDMFSPLEVRWVFCNIQSTLVV